jgi:hypothetical protein
MCVECAKRDLIYSSNIGNMLLDHIVLGMHNCEKLSFFSLTRIFVGYSSCVSGSVKFIYSVINVSFP